MMTFQTLKHDQYLSSLWCLSMGISKDLSVVKSRVDPFRPEYNSVSCSFFGMLTRQMLPEVSVKWKRKKIMH